MWRVLISNGRESGVHMSDFVQCMIVICFFLGYVITKPSRVEVKSKVDDGDAIKEVSVTITNDKKEN